MEIFGLAVLGIVSACIWSAWGPKVLLAVIVGLPLLGAGAYMIREQYREAEAIAYNKAQNAKNDAIAEKCRAWFKANPGELKFDDEQPWMTYGCNPFREEHGYILPSDGKVPGSYWETK
jgi:hypothetical protein